MNRPSGWSAATRSYPCRHCNAKPGEPCRTASGVVTSTPHGARMSDADRCYWCGELIPADPEDPGPRLCGMCDTYSRLLAERFHHRPRNPEAN